MNLKLNRTGATAQVPSEPAPAGPSASEADGPVLRIADLVVEFPTSHGLVRAVDGVSLEVPAGRRIAVVGESGSGKSTLALALLGLIDPPGRIAGGSIETGGVDLVGLSEEQLRGVRGGRVAMVFQDALGSLNPVMTIGSQLREAIELHTGVKGEAADRRAEELLREVGVPLARERLRQYPHELSGGMRQRVMIAMALSSDPRLLIADEPTTALDVTMQAAVMDLLLRLSVERGMAVILITHDLSVVAGFAEEVLVMYAGAPVEHAPIDAIFARPSHPYTQALIRAVPRIGDARSGRLHPIPGTMPSPGTVTTGCRFAARCRIGAARERCLTETPLFAPDGEGGQTACHFVEEARATRPLGDGAAAEVAPPQVSGEQLLAATELAKGYRSRGRTLRAVDAVSFDLRQGESLGLVGESGSGKSTVGRLLLGLTTRDGGSVTFEGEPLRISGRRLARGQRGRIQMVFQDPGDSLDPLMTVEQIVAEPLLLLGRREGRAGRVGELIELVGLGPEHRTRRPTQLSGGQRQRVAIARALATNPQLVICDEAVASLDVSVRAQILNLLGDLQTQLGLSYLFISHDLSVVRHVCDRVAVMYAGRFVEVAEVDRLFAAPQHPYTAALLSAVPVPDPQVERTRERIRLEGDLPDLTAELVGCPFRSRCWKADERCEREAPALIADADGHLRACHHPEREPIPS
jgi:peptide/nickel transport system ATP-binding protein